MVASYSGLYEECDVEHINVPPIFPTLNSKKKKKFCIHLFIASKFWDATLFLPFFFFGIQGGKYGWDVDMLDITKADEGVNTWSFYNQIRDHVRRVNFIGQFFKLVIGQIQTWAGSGVIP